MKTYKSFLKEEVDQFSFQAGGDINIMDTDTMMNINTHLARVSNDTYVTPHVGLEKVRQTLAYFNIALPKFNFYNPENGETAFEVMPFGGITGKDLSGNHIKEPSVTAYVYFAWERNDAGTFDIDVEIMSEADLEDLMGSDDDAAEDYEDDYEMVGENWKSSNKMYGNKPGTGDKKAKPHMVAQFKKMYDKKKKVNEARKPKEDEDDGGRHIVMQLRKVVSLSGAKPVTFADGKSAKISPDVAARFIRKYNNLTKPMDKEKLQAMAAASYDSFKKVVSEDFQIDELSLDKLRKYNNAASSDMVRKSHHRDNLNKSKETLSGDEGVTKAIDKSLSKTNKHINKRNSGIKMARQKMADKGANVVGYKSRLKEDEQIDELSKKTLKSYMSRADRSAEYNERKAAQAHKNADWHGQDSEFGRKETKRGIAHGRKADNRYRGMNRAEKKLGEEQVDEHFKSEKLGNLNDPKTIERMNQDWKKGVAAGKKMQADRRKDREKVNEISQEKIKDYLRANTKQTAQLRRDARPTSVGGKGDFNATLKANKRDHQFKKISRIFRNRREGTTPVDRKPGKYT